jgi:hypothetical protein
MKTLPFSSMNRILPDNPDYEVIDIQKKTKPKAHFTPKFNLYIREGVGASEPVLVVFPFSNQ